MVYMGLNHLFEGSPFDSSNRQTHPVHPLQPLHYQRTVNGGWYRVVFLMFFFVDLVWPHSQRLENTVHLTSRSPFITPVSSRNCSRVYFLSVNKARPASTLAEEVTCSDASTAGGASAVAKKSARCHAATGKILVLSLPRGLSPGLQWMSEQFQRVTGARFHRVKARWFHASSRGMCTSAVMQSGSWPSSSRG